MKIAIFGAAGAIGRVTLPELLGRCHTVRLVGRDPARLARYARPGVELLTADLADPVQARRAADGVEAILYSVGLPYPDSAQYPPLMRIAVEAAAAAGVGRLLAISTLYQYGRARTPRVAETHPREPHTVKGRNRKAQADIVLAAHDPRGLRTAILVLPDFYGADAELSYLHDILAAAVRGRPAIAVGPLDVPREFIYVPDAAPVIADLFERPELFGRIYHLGGGGTITQREVVRLAESAAGRRIAVLPVGKTFLRLVGTVNPMLREMVEMYELFTAPVVLDDTLLRSVLPVVRTTPYVDGIAASIAALRRAPVSHV